MQLWLFTGMVSCSMQLFCHHPMLLQYPHNGREGALNGDTKIAPKETTPLGYV